MYIDDRGNKVLVGKEAIEGFLRGIKRLQESRKLHYKTTFQDLPISIENRKGSIRRGTDPDGKEWETKHKHPYGYIPGTKGPDGDEVDVFVGPNEHAAFAYVIHINNPETGKYDEDKVMLGFNTQSAAVNCFKQHYDEPHKFYDSVDKIPMWKFRNKVFVKKHTTKKLVASRGGSPSVLPYDRGQQMVAPIALVARFYPDVLGSLSTHEQIEAFPDIESPDTIPTPLKKKHVHEAGDMFGEKGPYGDSLGTDQKMKKSILGHHQDIMTDPEVREGGPGSGPQGHELEDQDDKRIEQLKSDMKSPNDNERRRAKAIYNQSYRHLDYDPPLEESEEHGVKGMKWGVRHARKDAASEKHPVTGQPKHATKRSVVSHQPNRTMNQMGGDVAKGNALAAKLNAKNQQQTQQGKPVDVKNAHQELINHMIKELGWKAAGALARVAGVGGAFDSVKSILESPGKQKMAVKTDKNGNHSISPDKGNAASGPKLQSAQGLGKESGMMSQLGINPMTGNILAKMSDEIKSGVGISKDSYQQFKQAQAKYSDYGKKGGSYYKPEGEKFLKDIENKFIKGNMKENSFRERLGSFLREARRGKIYYARSLQRYGSSREAKDIDDLKEAYPDDNVTFPKTRRHAELGMGHFHKKIDKAKEVVITGLHRRKITAGVASEARHALKNGIPVRFLRKGKLRTVEAIENIEGGRPGGHYARVIFAKRKRKK